MTPKLPFNGNDEKPNGLVKADPFYATELGLAYAGDSVELLKSMPEKSVNLVMTSPPYALHYKKAYGNASKSEYVECSCPSPKKSSAF